MRLSAVFFLFLWEIKKINPLYLPKYWSYQHSDCTYGITTENREFLIFWCAIIVGDTRTVGGMQVRCSEHIVWWGRWCHHFFMHHHSGQACRCNGRACRCKGHGQQLLRLSAGSSSGGHDIINGAGPAQSFAFETFHETTKIAVTASTGDDNCRWSFTRKRQREGDKGGLGVDWHGCCVLVAMQDVDAT